MLHDRLREEVDQGNAWIGAIRHTKASHDGLAVDILKHWPGIDGQRIFAVLTDDGLSVVLGPLGWQRHRTKRGVEEGRNRFFVLDAQECVQGELGAGGGGELADALLAAVEHG